MHPGFLHHTSCIQAARTHLHMQHPVPIVSHFRQQSEELLALLFYLEIFDGNRSSLWNQMEGLIMHRLPWQQQNPASFWLSLCESLNSHHHTAQQMGGKKKKKRDAMHWGLLKAPLIFKKPVLLCRAVYRTHSLPCVKSFYLHRAFRQAKMFLWQHWSLINAKSKAKQNKKEHLKILIKKSQKSQDGIRTDNMQTLPTVQLHMNSDILIAMI